MEWKLAKTNEQKGYKIIDVFEKDNKMYANCEISKVCERCGGSGIIPYFGYVEGGVCFACGGRDTSHNIEKAVLRVYTEDERTKMDAAAEKRNEIKQAEALAMAEINRKEWKETRGIGEDDKICFIVNCNSYSIKDELKAAGAWFNAGLGWCIGAGKLATANIKIPEGGFWFETTFSDTFVWNGSTLKFSYKDADATREAIKAAVASRNQTTFAGSRHYGSIGDRLRKVPATFLNSRFISGCYGDSYLYTFQIGEDVFTWFTQSQPKFKLEKGQQILLSGTIKQHTEYNGVQQTQLTRCILTEV